MTDLGFPLDLTTVASHVAARLDRVAPAALSVEELAADYRHPNTGDVSRVKNLNGYTSDKLAVVWMIHKAVNELEHNGAGGRRQLELMNGGGKIRLADGLRMDDLRFRKRKLYEVRDAHALLRDPFNPMSGAFSEDIRQHTSKRDNMEELRSSMRELGWIPELPAIKDERGVTLVGHRRLQVAAELRADGVDIVDNVSTIRCGDGDEADAKRLRLALASNLGAKPFTPEDRRKIAEYLYGEQNWTMERIGEALGVSRRQVGYDLAGLEIASKPSRPKGGRPKGSGKRAMTDAQMDAAYKLVTEEGMSRTEACVTAGWTGEPGKGNIPSIFREYAAKREAVEAEAYEPATKTPAAKPEIKTYSKADRPAPEPVPDLPHCPTCTCAG